MVNPPDSAETARAAVIEAARNGAYDRYASALLAPRTARDALLALAAFEAELTRIAPATRREPRMGEIRLQWWRETLESPDASSGHPVADAIKAASRAQGWAIEPLIDIIDAHAHDGLVDAFADDQEMLATLELGEATMFRLGARACGAATGEGLDQLSAQAGVAYGIARRIAALPHFVAQGHLPLSQARLSAAGIDPAQVLAGNSQGLLGVLVDLADLARDRLGSARQALAGLPRAQRSAFLPLALVESYLDGGVRPGRDPLRESPDVSHFGRLVRLVRAQVFGRV